MPRSGGQKIAIALPIILALCSLWIIAEDWLTQSRFNTSYAIMLVIALAMLWVKLRETRG